MCRDLLPEVRDNKLPHQMTGHNLQNKGLIQKQVGMITTLQCTISKMNFTLLHSANKRPEHGQEVSTALSIKSQVPDMLHPCEEALGRGQQTAQEVHVTQKCSDGGQ